MAFGPTLTTQPTEVGHWIEEHIGKLCDGDLGEIRESCLSLGQSQHRATERRHYWTGWGQDLRYALRTLRATPVLTTVAVVSIALGVGANTAVFTLLDQVLLRPLPVSEPARLVRVATSGYYYGSTIGDGRELSHQELGWQVLQRVKVDTEPIAKVESEPRMEGRQMVMVLAPR